VKTKSFRGSVTAGKGLLLGGVKVVMSSRFETIQQARDWIEVTVKANQQAGRDIFYVGIEPSGLEPEITAQETGHEGGTNHE